MTLLLSCGCIRNTVLAWHICSIVLIATHIRGMLLLLWHLLVLGEWDALGDVIALVRKHLGRLLLLLLG